MCEFSCQTKMPTTEPREIWLEDLSMAHIRDVHKMFLDPTMQMLR